MKEKHLAVLLSSHEISNKKTMWRPAHPHTEEEGPT